MKLYYFKILSAWQVLPKKLLNIWPFNVSLICVIAAFQAYAKSTLIDNVKESFKSTA